MKLKMTMKTAAYVILALPFLNSAILAGEGKDLDTGIYNLQSEWARIYYQVPDHELQEEAIDNLAIQAHELSDDFPGRAEPKIWEGIILSTSASINGGLSALGKVKRARVLFEEALEIDDMALDGSAYTSLGSLYYQVPGWPIAFGDDEEAEELLLKALAINPDGIDPNYFYGDYLAEQGRLSEAKKHLEKALTAPNRPGRSLADKGRRQEIKAALEEIN